MTRGGAAFTGRLADTARWSNYPESWAVGLHGPGSVAGP